MSVRNRQKIFRTRARRLTFSRKPSSTCTIGLALTLVAIVSTSGIAAKADLAGVPLAVRGALTFLVVASTLLGYAVFLALNVSISSTLANTFNHAVPVIALLLSALLLHEPLTTVKLMARGLSVALMINRGATGARHPTRSIR